MYPLQGTFAQDLYILHVLFLIYLYYIIMQEEESKKLEPTKSQKLKPTKNLRASLSEHNYYTIELNEPIQSNNPMHYGLTPPVEVKVVKGKIVSETPSTSKKDGSLLLEDKDKLGRRFTQRVNKLNIKRIHQKYNVEFLSYKHGDHDHSLLVTQINDKINKYVGTGGTKRRYAKKRRYTKKNRKINKK